MPRQTSIKFSPVGMKIEFVRRHKNIPLTQLAKGANLDYSQLYRIMHGLSKPSPESLSRICNMLECTPEETAEIFAETPYRVPVLEESENEVGSKSRKRNKIAA